MKLNPNYPIFKLDRILAAICIITQSATAAPLEPNGFVESEQKFMRSALVISSAPMNRARRGILLQLGEGYWTCFDPDLLRYAATWKTIPTSAPLSMNSMASVSYPNAKAKAESPPLLIGTILHQSPELPGVGIDQLPEKDIRSNIVIGTEDKLGPLPFDHARYLGLTHTNNSVTLSYQIGTRIVKETNQLTPNGDIERVIGVSPGKQSIVINLDHSSGKITTSNSEQIISYEQGQTKQIKVNSESSYNLITDANRGTSLVIKEANKETEFRVTRSFTTPAEIKSNSEINKSTRLPFMEKVQVSRSNSSPPASPITIHDLSFPDNNPWKRAIRPTDIAFLANGDALLTTLDGDVWRIKGISEQTATWSRVAFGIFEPMSIAISQKDEVFVLGRDQITRLVDADKDGFFENYMCASDAITQTLHSRDYQTSLELESDGSFLIGRSGLTSDSKKRFEENTPERGSVIRISADGKKTEILADGLRLPFIGKRNDGTIFASDQQGHFVPSTPVYLISQQKNYLGFEPANYRKINDPTQPLIWFPYEVNRSASSFSNLSKKGFPSMEDAFVHLSWSGRIFPIVTPKQGIPFVWKLPVNFNFPILGAATHPINGKLYATGIGISGYKPQTPKESGLAEISESAAFANPVSLEIKPESITIGFLNPLLPGQNLITPLPEIDLWNIQRTKNYGSGHYRWDNKPGKHSINSEKILISPDRRTVTISTTPLFRSDIFRLKLHLSDTKSSSSPYTIEIYATPHHLPTPSAQDLESVNEREQKNHVAMIPGDIKIGETVFNSYGCSGCHSLKGEKLTGPPLNGISSQYNGKIDNYLRTSILAPAAEITKGYEASMPSFEGVIPEQNILHLIAYLKSL